jgi:mannose-6-phosphate isomerase
MGAPDLFDAKHIVRLDNPILEYDWGSRTALPELLGRPSPAPKPQAELWMGAHSKAPSRVEVAGSKLPLDVLIEAKPAAVLGERVLETFGPRLPFLFKVLAVERALSIQAHPDAEQAPEGFAREERLGIGRGARERCYPDDSHKPEILCALGEFHALCGFRPIPEIQQRLAALDVAGLRELRRALETPDEEHALRRLLEEWLGIPDSERSGLLEEVVAAARSLAAEDSAFAWLPRLHEQQPGDLGMLAPVFLNLVMLAPGEAVFLPARELHCYLEGVGVELMASSDNVLRGGLTSKHVALPELLRILRFASRRVEVLKPRLLAEGLEAYLAPAAEFELSRLEVGSGTTLGVDAHGSVEILICTAGAVEVRPPAVAAPLSLAAGQSCLVPAGVGEYHFAGSGTLYRASVPR